MRYHAWTRVGMLVAALSALSFSGDSAVAQFPNLSSFDPGPAIGRAVASLDPGPAINNAFNPNPLPGRDFTRIHVRNNTSRKIYVAARLFPFSSTPPSETSHLSGPGGSGSEFQTYAWYELFPNQEAYVGNTNDHNIYTFAHDEFGNQWAGNDFHVVYEGGQPRSIGFRWQMFGLSLADYTVDFQ